MENITRLGNKTIATFSMTAEACKNVAGRVREHFKQSRVHCRKRQLGLYRLAELIVYLDINLNLLARVNHRFARRQLYHQVARHTKAALCKEENVFMH